MVLVAANDDDKVSAYDTLFDEVIVADPVILLDTLTDPLPVMLMVPVCVADCVIDSVPVMDPVLVRV